MIEITPEVTNYKLLAIISSRRAGNPVKLIASSKKTQEILR